MHAERESDSHPAKRVQIQRRNGLKRHSWPRLLMWTAAAVVATPLVFAGGVLLVKGEPAPAPAGTSLPKAVAEADAAPVGPAEGGGGTPKKRIKPAVRIAGYDKKAGRATLDSDRGAPIKSGQVIVSDRTKRLPHGALVKVTNPVPDSKGTVAVAPATLPDLLGDAKIHSATPVSPAGITVKSLVDGVSGDVTKAAGKPAKPASATKIEPAPLPTSEGRHNIGGLLKLDLDVPLAGHGFRATKQGGPTLRGWVHFQPQVLFEYQRDQAGGLAPTKATIGIGGAYDYGWKLHAALAGTVDTGKKPLRLPFAEVHVSQTIMVGALPIVIDADLTYFYQVTATGQISIDTEQKTVGEVQLGAQFRKDTGWKQLPTASPATTTGTQLRIAGSGEGRATIGAQATVALYGMVGVAAEFAPYLRAEIETEIVPTQQLDWALFVGLDLRSALLFQLKILGIPIFEHRIPLPPLHAEWKVSEGQATPETLPKPKVAA